MYIYVLKYDFFISAKTVCSPLNENSLILISESVHELYTYIWHGIIIYILEFQNKKKYPLNY